MNPYTHLTMNERETIFLMYEQGETIGHISETLDRSKSTISRELHRNSNKDGSYSPSTAHGVFCKTFLHNIAKKKYTPLRLKFFSDYFGLDRAFLSRKLSPVKLKMCA